MRYRLIALSCGWPLLAGVNPRELVRQSIANGAKAWSESRAYSCTKLDVDQQFDAGGRVKSTDRDVYRIVPIAGDAFEEHVEHDGEPLRGVPRVSLESSASDRITRKFRMLSTLKSSGKRPCPPGRHGCWRQLRARDFSLAAAMHRCSPRCAASSGSIRKTYSG